MPGSPELNLRAERAKDAKAPYVRAPFRVLCASSPTALALGHSSSGHSAKSPRKLGCTLGAARDRERGTCSTWASVIYFLAAEPCSVPGLSGAGNGNPDETIATAAFLSLGKSMPAARVAHVGFYNDAPAGEHRPQFPGASYWREIALCHCPTVTRYC